MSSTTIEVTMSVNYALTTAGESMREVPKSTLPDEALDKAKCREAVESALSQPEPQEAFDRHAWLEKTKDQLKRHASANQ